MKTSLKHKVEYTLKNHEQARNCDNVLIAYFLNDWYPKYFRDTFFDMRELKECPNVYDIIRYRKIIQNTDGLYKASEEVREKRFNKQIDTRRELGYNPELIYPI